MPIMPVIGAFSGAIFAVMVASFKDVPWGIGIGFLLGIAYELHQSIKAAEESSKWEIGQLRRRLESLELKLKKFSTEHAAQPVEVEEPTAKIEAQSERVEAPPPLPSETARQELFASQAAESPVRSGIVPPESESVPSLLERVVNYFTTGNAIAKIGVILLFFGIAFLLKYVSDQGLFPIELRLLGTAMGAIVLLGLGWKLRERKGPFGLLLQGGGVGIFYLTVFAAFRLYQLLPASLAFGLLLAVVILSSCLAVMQNARSLAVFSVSGGFLAPVLASTGQGSHVLLFSYYAILNLGILGMSWFRSWRDLNLVGFAFTFVIGGIWGYQYYRPEFFASTEPFLVLFLLLYLAVTLLFSTRKRAPGSLVVDGTLVFGVPVAAFALQSGLVRGSAYGLAWSALSFGALYLGIARFVLRRAGDQLKLLAEAFFGIGVCFLTLAVPLAVDGKTTAAVWALEAAAILWVGIRQNRFLPRLSGLVLQLLAGFAFILTEPRSSASLPVLNAFFMGTLVLSIAHLITGLFLHRADLSQVRNWEKGVGPWFLALGMFWWFFGGVTELSNALPVALRINGYLLYFALSSLLFHSLSRKLPWGMLGVICLGLIPASAFLAFSLFGPPSWGRDIHPFSNIGAAAWGAVFAVHYRILREDEIVLRAEFSKFQHFSAFWLLSALVSWEAYWGAGQLIPQAGIWARVTLALAPGLLALGVIRSTGKSFWPIGPERLRYLGTGVRPHLAWGMLWLTYLNFTDSGAPGLLSYFPILNPLDLAQLFFFVVLGYWALEAGKARIPLGADHRAFAIATGLSAFVWLTACLTRTLHHWAGLPWDFGALFASNLVQASLSIFWSIVSLTLMILATRRKWRVLWIAGASLLGIVVVKLFSVDLSGAGTLERVVSFIGTGVLLLLIGYLAPIPPGTERSAVEAA